jgi:CDP-2,3-bis-(O-geranylgeranyl)-sn-glycerol synthase
MSDQWARLLQLAYFMLPAYCANMAPPFTRYWRGWNRPIHERLLGSHKTVLGVLAGVATGVLVAGMQSRIHAPWSLVDYRHWLLLGLGLGGGAMLGDALKSLIKRMLHIRPGARWIPFDQLDFVIGALALTGAYAGLGATDVAAIVTMTFVGDIAINQLSYRLGIKDSPW